MHKLIQLLDDLKVPHVERGNEHCREGWVQVSCPFCPGGDHDFHLGINLAGAYTSCYRCGFHSFESLLKAVGDIPRQEASGLKRMVFPSGSNQSSRTVTEVVRAKYDFVLPSEGPASEYERAYRYLQKRLGDDACKLIDMYDLRFTGMTYKYPHPTTASPYKYANSIVIPNRLDGTVVSFQTRSFLPGMTGYMTAKPEEELFHHKHFLWGIDLVPLNSVIVVEGVFNAMSIGPGAVHTHGCQFTKNQVDELATFDKVYVAYDRDAPGELATKKLLASLSHRTAVYVLKYGEFAPHIKDPNDLMGTVAGRKELQDMRSLVQ